MAQTFSGLGFLPGGSSSWATAVSSDGTSVIGNSPTQSWRWTQLGGMVPLGTLQGFADRQSAWAVSFDGSTVIGDGLNSQTASHLPFRWTIGSGLGPLDGGLSNALQLGVSGDGTYGVGGGPDGVSSYTAFRSSIAGGREGLGPLLGTPHGPVGHSSAAAADFDGSVIVGFGDAIQQVSPPIQIPTPFRWTAATGMQAMLQSNGQLLRGAATDIAADAGVIVGFQGNGSTFFRWTEASGYQFITPFAGIHNNFTVRISGDGSTIIGLDTYWTAATGPLRLTDVLTSAGCDFSGWSITGATGISYDGRTLCGEGIDPAGNREAWIATIPTPATLLPLLTVAATARRRRD